MSCCCCRRPHSPKRAAVSQPSVPAVFRFHRLAYNASLVLLPRGVLLHDLVGLVRSPCDSNATPARFERVSRRGLEVLPHRDEAAAAIERDDIPRDNAEVDDFGDLATFDVRTRRWPLVTEQE